MIYNKFVEIGRVAFIASGKNEQKLAVIVDVVDGNRVLLDGPSSGVARGVRNLKDLHLTKYKIPIRVGQRTKKVQQAYDEAKINDAWNKSSWAQKLQKRKLRAGLNDFERFKVSRVKQLRNRVIAKEFAKLRKSANKK
ncbi:60S ribosomal protein L14 [Aphelenchoides bicaudatus]|nr:60S ribosomal protein L14 [Aphelenchoides bicaudatus]